MGEGRRILYLILIMTVVAVVVAGVAIYLLYRITFEEQRLRLVEIAQTQARFLEAVARFNAIYSQDYPEGAEAATLSQLIDAHEQYPGFGETGEFALARSEGDYIVFVFRQRQLGLTYPPPILLDSELAEPMRRALAGKSGSVVGLDYRGETVLAAYEPVAELNLGIVAKIDITEVNAPFFRAGLMTLLAMVLVILVGIILFFRVSDPIIRRLREYSENLEGLVKERTRELQAAQEKLLLQERLATLGQFSGSISHELRNPLGVVDSSVYYLKARLKDADEKVQQHLDRIKSSVVSATAIIESLLNLTRMKEPQMARLDLLEVTSDAIATSKVPATVRVIRNFLELEVPVNADREQLSLVLKNIIKNAVEAMDGKGTLTVTIQKTDDGQAKVSFADTGPGITAENLDRVFEPLFSTKAKGIGFGLSIARMVVDRHGGTIEAQSGTKKGTIFTIFIIKLPLHVDKDKEI